jgi:hypothetical protein
LPESDELACVLGRERAGKGSPTAEGSILGVGWPWEAAAAGRAAARQAVVGAGKGRDKVRRGGGTHAQMRRPTPIYAGVAHRAAWDGPVVSRAQPTAVRSGGFEAHRGGCGLGWREPRDGARTAGCRPALVRAYDGAPRGAARGVVLWSVRAQPTSTRAEPFRSSLFDCD